MRGIKSQYNDFPAESDMILIKPPGHDIRLAQAMRDCMYVVSQCPIRR